MLYMVASYLVVGILAYIVFRSARQHLIEKRGHRNTWLWPLLAVLFLLPLAPYAVVESRTAYWRASLLPATQQALAEISGGSEPMLSFKVLSVQQNQAEVYAVTLRRNPKPLCASGLAMTLAKTAKGWQFTGNYRAVWSDCGSASGNIFPPYPDKSDYKY